MTKLSREASIEMMVTLGRAMNPGFDEARYRENVRLRLTTTQPDQPTTRTGGAKDASSEAQA